MRWNPESVRSNGRLVSGLILFAFVLCHLTAHGFLLLSFERAEAALTMLMWPWRTAAGTAILLAALLVHVLNALWSIYVRRYLRLSRWEWWQLGLGLCVPLLLMLHVTGTRIGEAVLGVASHHRSVLLGQWLLSPWLGVVQAAAVLVVWTHACIGIHFWLRIKPWYRAWRPLLFALGLTVPLLALSGYVAAGNQVLRAAHDPGYVRAAFAESNLDGRKRAEINRIARAETVIYLGLVSLPFIARGIRHWRQRRRRPPRLTHSSGEIVSIPPGATVLETLRGNAIPHAAVCGGRGPCTTCRILVTRGSDALGAPSELEAKALARIGAAPRVRLACQVRPTADIAVLPLLGADAVAAEGISRGGLEGSERLITVLIVDLRGSTALSEAKLPYDLLYVLNQFFREMTRALDASNGHYAQFAGDGLLALYGLSTASPDAGAVDAVRGAREMLARIARLNSRLRGELSQPMRIGIAIHFGEAIVGTMGPPQSQITSAIGDMVNTCARLSDLTKEFDCAVIISEHAAEAAGLDLARHRLHQAPVRGRAQTARFYALPSLADLIR